MVVVVAVQVGDFVEFADWTSTWLLRCEGETDT